MNPNQQRRENTITEIHAIDIKIKIFHLSLRQAQGTMENLYLKNYNKVIKMDDAYFAHLIRYRDIMFLMGNFLRTLVGNLQKDTPFPHTALRRLLIEAGIHKER